MRPYLPALLLLAVAAAAGAVPVTGAAGASLQSLAGSSTMVTVVLKDGGAKDANLKVLEVHAGYFTVLTEKGDRIPYLFESVAEVQVQGEVVERTPLDLRNSRVLRAEDQQMRDDAVARAKELFDGSAEDQARKMRAAALLAVSGHDDATAYLTQLAATNDLRTTIDASLHLYAVGADIAEKAVRDGLRSGNRSIRAKAAVLAGLTGYSEGTPMLSRMALDRIAEFGPAAVIALARLGDRAVVPDLVNMLGDLNEAKANAAVAALVLMGGDDLVEQLQHVAKNEQGMMRFRAILTLYRLGAPQSTSMLQEQMRDVPTLMPDAALDLARKSDYEATQYLRRRLDRREDDTDANLAFRALNAASLIAGGDPSAIAVYQQMLRGDNNKIKARAFHHIVEIGDRRLLTIMQPSLLNVDKDVALGSCEAVIALTTPEFRQRVLDLRHGLPMPNGDEG